MKGLFRRRHCCSMYRVGVVRYSIWRIALLQCRCGRRKTEVLWTLTQLYGKRLPLLDSLIAGMFD